MRNKKKKRGERNNNGAVRELVLVERQRDKDRCEHKVKKKELKVKSKR